MLPMKNKEEVKRSYRREVVHGIGGVGKSTGLGVVSKNPLVLDFDNRWPSKLVGKADFPKFEQDYTGVLNILNAILNEPSITNDRIVIDTATKLLGVVEDYVLARDCKGEREKYNAYGHGVKFLRQYFKEVLGLIDAIQAKHKVTVTFICHTKLADFKSITSEAYKKATMDLPEGISDLLKQWADYIGYAWSETPVDKIKHTASGDSVRYISFAENPSYDAKNSSDHKIANRIRFDEEGTWAEVVFGQTQPLLKDLDTLLGKCSEEQRKVVEGLIESSGVRSLGVKALSEFIETGKQKLGVK